MIEKIDEEFIEKHFQKSYGLRNKFWTGIGKVDADVVAPIINPSFMGGPRWPSLRQAFITVRRGTSSIIASDGLSDPFNNPRDEESKSYNGFGLELYVETPGNLDPVIGSWQFNVVYSMSQAAVGAGNIQASLQEYQYISSELFDIGLPEPFREKFQDSDGRSGVIFGLPSNTVPSSVTLSLEFIDIVNVKLLTLRELDYIDKYGTNGRNQVAKLLMAEANSTFSDLDRKSVI